LRKAWIVVIYFLSFVLYIIMYFCTEHYSISYCRP